MQSQNKFFDDLAKVLNGAAGTFAGMAREAQGVARDKAREFVGTDEISREEFDAVKDMLANARSEITALRTRVDVLERGEKPAAPGKKAKNG